MAAEDKLLVLGTWSSPWVIRVRVALGLKGLRYDYAEEDLARKSDLLLRSNPVHGKVPVLIHGGQPVCESLVILQYLDEAWPTTGAPALLLPDDDPYGRATARFWAAYVNDTFFPAWRTLFKSTTADQRAAAFANVVATVEPLERALAERSGPFFGGDTIGLVDVVLGSHLVWIKVVDEVAGVNLLDEASFPGLAAWAERFLALDVVKEVMPDPRKVMEQYKGFMVKWTASGASSSS